MRIRHWFISLMLLVLIVSCGPATTAEQPEALDGAQLDSSPALMTGTPFSLPTAVDESKEIEAPIQTPAPDDSYPLQPTPQPAPNNNDGYPLATIVVPTVASYPGAYPAPDGFVWILQPMGEQCEESGQFNYKDLQAAIEALTAAGITVSESEVLNLQVCSACGCPTSVHFHVLIPAGDLAAAVSLGWQAE